MDTHVIPGPGPRSYQSEVASGLLRAIERYRGETLTVMFPRQSGKNEVSAMVVCGLLLAHAADGGTLVHCAPTLEPQGRISFERTRGWLERAGAALGIPVRVGPDMRLGVGRAGAAFLSGSPGANVAGHTASIALIADEAQDLDREWFERQFRPMAASTGAATVLFGTAWDGQSLLEEAAARNRRLDGETPGAIRRHYEVSWHDVGDALPAYRTFVEQERDRLGAGHPLFLTQYALEPARGAGRLFGPDELAALAGSHRWQRHPQRDERYIAGLDPGGDRARSDASVLTIGRLAGDHCEVVHLAAWQGVAYDALIAEVTRIARHWGIVRLCVDASGLGGPLAATLQQQLGHIVNPVTFTGEVKSALGWNLVAAAGSRRLRLPAEDGRHEPATLWRELRACRRELRHGGRLRWGDEAGGDDYVVSLALCLRAAGSTRPPRLARGRNRNRYN